MNKNQPIFCPKKGKVMNVIVFASGGGGNLKAAIRLSLKKPKLIKIGLVVTDRPNIPAIDIASKYQIPVLVYDFEKECGVWKEYKKDPKKTKKYRQCAVLFHNRVLKEIKKIEAKNQLLFDLVVLSYHRWIEGKLLKYFEGRMINQHAGDLTIKHDQQKNIRKYIGINPVLMALKAGETKTRTSTFLVRDNHDGGEILCQGPWVKYQGPYPISKESAWQHELDQKKESDWPALTFTLTGIAKGHFAITTKKYQDGCHILTYQGKSIPYGGVSLSN